MPLYDIICHEHGFFEDVLLDSDAPRCCPECGEPAISPPVIVFGVVDGEVTAAGRRFRSRSDKDAYLKANGINEFAKGSADDRRIADKARDRAEKAARRQGYNDLDHRNSVVRREVSKGWTVKEG